jgi:hypothetical protein
VEQESNCRNCNKLETRFPDEVEGEKKAQFGGAVDSKLVPLDFTHNCLLLCIIACNTTRVEPRVEQLQPELGKDSFQPKKATEIINAPSWFFGFFLEAV